MKKMMTRKMITARYVTTYECISVDLYLCSQWVDIEKEGWFFLSKEQKEEVL